MDLPDLSLTPEEKRKLQELLILHQSWQRMNWMIGVPMSQQPPELILQNNQVALEAQEQMLTLGD